tara:strand:+ start:547 stop:771 length:225 start_codon:yes stop_codon:yes gene_type:complete
MMPKYYVSCMGVDEVLDAEHPVEACAKICEKLNFTTAGCFWKVSEKGFSSNDDDAFIDDLLINRWLRHKYNKDD